MLAGTPPGGGQDRAARALATALQAELGLDVAVVNVPGRGGGVAWERVAHSEGELRLVAISSPTLLTNAIREETEPVHDAFTHLALLCTEAIAFAVASDTGPSTAAELLEQLAARRAPIRFGIATALGNVNHVAVSIVSDSAGVRARDIDVTAFDSARTAVGELLAHHIDVVAVSAASVLPEVETGGVRALALTTTPGMPGALADVPTWSELGVPCDLGTWRGLIGSPGLGVSDIAGWDHRLAEALAGSAWQEAVRRHVWTDTYLPSAGATRFVEDQDRLLRHRLAGLERTGG
jgi:putative tricarboxylic transport membrane protein